MENNSVGGGIHPSLAEFSAAQIASDPILQFFHYAHLPAVLRAISKPFCDVAGFVVTELPRNAERTVALRKLLEAKDCAVRAKLPRAGIQAAHFHGVNGPALGEPIETGGFDEDRNGPPKFSS